MKVGKIDVTITNPDRVLFPADGITKADLVRHYVEIADLMLPHLRERPLNVQRFPRGIGAPGFIQQAAPPNPPEWVKTVEVEKEGGTVKHVVVENAATLAWLANLSCVTMHVWLGRTGDLDRPDRMVLDLDPAEDDFEVVRDAARALKSILDGRGMPAYLMATGSRGLHVVVPLRPALDSDGVRDVADQIAGELAATNPKRLTTKLQKEDRKGRLFIDTLRNAYGHTAVAPFSVRPRPAAPVAAPLRWQDLDDPDLTARRYTVRDLARLRRDARDAWKGFENSAIVLAAAARKAA
jgi:bifunctional non-homologous end joining protein LigD